LQSNNVEGFESSLSEAKDLTYAVDPTTDITSGFYCLGTVYEEYARSYATLERPNEAMEYIDLAEKNLPATGHWQTLLMTARAMTLVHSGDIANGTQLAVEAAQLCYKQGDYRHLERIYSIQAYLDQVTRRFGNASALVRDALHGPVEYTG